MLRLIWIIVALAASAFAGALWFGNAPVVINAIFTFVTGSVPPDGIAGNVALTICAAVVIAATMAFLLIYIGLAAVDFYRFQGLAGRLEALRPAPGNDGDADLRNFYQAFRNDDELARLASEYGTQLHRSEKSGDEFGLAPRRLIASIPAKQIFRRELLVDRALIAPVFRYLPVAVINLGLIGLALALFVGFGAAPADAGDALTPALASSAQAGILILSMAAVSAVLMGLLYRVILVLRYQQHDRVCRAIDLQFLGPMETDYLRDLARANKSSSVSLEQAVRQGLLDMTERLENQSKQLTETFQRDTAAASERLAASVQQALSEPLGRLAEIAGQQSQDQSERTEAVLSTTLSAFVAELEKSFGNQLKEVNVLLQSSTAMAANLESTFAKAAQTLTDMSNQQSQAMVEEIRKGVAEAEKAETEARKALTTDMERFAHSMSDEVKGHSQAFQSLLNTMLDRIEYLTESAVATSAADLARTAESFGHLREMVESLVLSLTPVVNQVVDTQNRLISALEDDQAGSKVIARSASDMSAAARASRETVERFIVLAEKLSESRTAGGALPQQTQAAPAAPMPSPQAPAPADAPSDGKLSKALRQLRESAEDSARKLPKL